jgi:hypothetical protein
MRTCLRTGRPTRYNGFLFYTVTILGLRQLDSGHAVPTSKSYRKSDFSIDKTLYMRPVPVRAKVYNSHTRDVTQAVDVTDWHRDRLLEARGEMICPDMGRDN